MIMRTRDLVSDTNMGAKEFLIVKMTSTDQYNTVESAMNSRVETQKGIFEGYAPEQYAMVENYELCHEGNYVLLVISEDPQRRSMLLGKACKKWKASFFGNDI